MDMYLDNKKGSWELSMAVKSRIQRLPAQRSYKRLKINRQLNKITLHLIKLNAFKINKYNENMYK